VAHGARLELTSSKGQPEQELLLSPDSECTSEWTFVGSDITAQLLHWMRGSPHGKTGPGEIPNWFSLKENSENSKSTSRRLRGSGPSAMWCLLFLFYPFPHYLVRSQKHEYGWGLFLNQTRIADVHSCQYRHNNLTEQISRVSHF
jgi:hypothetical protein